MPNENNNTPAPETVYPRKGFRFPWKAVHLPVVPAVFDNSLSLLEVCQKLLYWINEAITYINALHEDIINLKEYVDEQDAAMLTAAEAYADAAVASLKDYVDTQDAAMLAAAKTYADGLYDSLKAYVDAQDAATLAAAKSYADTQDAATLAAAKAYADTQDAATLTAAKAYADTQDAATLAAAKAYADAQDAIILAGAKSYADGLDTALRADMATALALKLDKSEVIDDIIEDSTRPVTSGAVFAALDAINQRANVILNFAYDVDTQTLTTATPNAFNVATAALNADKFIYCVLTVSGTVTVQRADKYYLQLDKFTGNNMITFACNDYTLTGTSTGWAIS